MRGKDRLMGRRAKLKKGKAGAKRPLARKSPNADAPRIPELQARLADALKERVALSEILRVISQSPTDAQPVFEAIVRNGVQVCGANACTVFVREGEMVRLGATDIDNPAYAAQIRALYPAPIDADLPPNVAIRERRIIHLPDTENNPEALPVTRRVNQAAGYRTVLFMPMLRDASALGAVVVARTDPAPFSERQIELLQTFAAQAVIAIENVRLFRELDARNHDLTAALDKQTATAEILRAISHSHENVRPVFDAIARSAARLCFADLAAVGQVVDGQIVVRGNYGMEEGLLRQFPRPVDATSNVGLAILERRIVHIPDLEDPSAYRGIPSTQFRGQLSVPMFRGDEALGVVTVARYRPGPFTEQQIALLQTFADQAVIAIENVRLFTELEARNRDLTATSEILRVISGSPTDVQPVFGAIAKSAARLTGAVVSTVYEFDGALIHLRVIEPADFAHGDDFRQNFPRPPTPDFAAGRVILEGTLLHRADLWNDLDTPELTREWARTMDLRSILWVPMLREGAAIGVIGVVKRESGLFGDEQVQLLRTFADQAVIAIENVRLFTELQASNRELTTALDTQTATSDILRVISRSPADVQPVFQAIVKSAARLLRGNSGVLSRIVGDQIELAAFTRTDEAGDALLTSFFPISLQSSGSETRPIRDRVIGERIPYNVADVETDPRVGERGRANARARGYRSQLVVPMLRHDEPIGTIAVTRSEPGAFSDDEIVLLQTFADQAVIAIENARLFTELEASNRELTDALARQTATAEVLRVISRSQMDIQPVFAAILNCAVGLCGADTGGIVRIEDGQLVFVDFYPNTPENLVVLRAHYPRPVDTTSLTGRAAVEARVIHVPDVRDPATPAELAGISRGVGFRSSLSVPILRDGRAIGVLALQRRAPGPFSDVHIELVQAFADQAVIAIENARLLSELHVRTAELTQSVGELRALNEVGQAISSTLDLQTVLSTIVARATQLAGADAGIIYEYDAEREVFEPRATEHLAAEIVEVLVTAPVRKGEGATGQLAISSETVHLPDIHTDSLPNVHHARGAFLRAGYRALLAVPLLREDHLIGGLTVVRTVPGEFPHETIELLQTFATQSALAIQNARLFREIEDKSRQLEAASQHKSEFLANMSHELRTPLNAIIGFSEVLTARMFGELNEKQDEYLKDIYASGQHLLSLINDILDLSKIEAGRMELEPEDFDLASAIDNAVTLVRERAGRRGITLGREIDERVGTIRADERKVKQVLLNLLSNAIKFTPEGGRIDVRAGVRDDFAEISVGDTGVGIAPEDQEAVFEEFRQVGAADKKVEGTGLGLALCRRFVELHSGRIWVKSQVGQGSTFTFTLPVRRGG